MASANPAQNYSDYRPCYPMRLISDLRERTVGEHGEQMVDWGAGTGQLTLPLSRSFDRVTAIDTHSGMVSVGRSNAWREGIDNIEWRIGRAEDFEMSSASCDLIVAGSSFHWMDRDLLARRAFTALKPGAALALASGGGQKVWNGTTGWPRIAMECLAEYGADKRSPGRRPRSLVRSNDDLLTTAGFALERLRYSGERAWGPKDIIGYLYVISFALPRLLGDRREEFERDLADALKRARPAGIFHEKFDFQLMLARRP